MKRYKLIEHTADIGLIAYGNTLAEAFGNAAFGMFSIIAELDNVVENQNRCIELKSSDQESLLFEWLNRLLYYFDVDLLLFRSFKVNILPGNRLTAICYGEKYDRLRHKLKTGVKSATYHKLKVDGIKNEVQVIFDV
ncbi:MAG: archease [Dehalococcoidia bacterium]|nr:MAG: archease [Dehalococcoidia bacterium]